VFCNKIFLSISHKKVTLVEVEIPQEFNLNTGIFKEKRLIYASFEKVSSISTHAYMIMLRECELAA
jgi:hypothetical protein